MRVSIEHGQGTAIVGVGGVALVHGSTELDVVGLLTDLVGQRDPDIGSLVDGLAAFGVRDLPSFGVVLFGGTESRLMVRGTVAATVTTDDGSQRRYDGIRVSTWVEDAVPIEGVTLAIGGNEGPPDRFWVESGVVPAGSVRWGITVDGPATEAGTAAVVPDPNAEAFETAVQPAVPEAEEEPVGFSSAGTRVEEPAAAEPAGGVGGEPSGPDAEPRYDFTHLVDHTVFRSPGEAIVRLDELEEEVAEPIPSEPEPSVTQAEPSAPMPTMPPDHTRPYPDMISEVPLGIGPEEPEPQATEMEADLFEVPAGQLGDHDGHTIARRRRPSEPEPTVLGPDAAYSGISLTGVLCPAGHGNNPIAEDCLTCGTQIVDYEPQQVQRPSLGALRLPSGEAIGLTSPIVMGRNPVAVGLINGEVPQNLVIDDELISRNHAQIVLEGWNVLVSDLNSTNQTTIILPGQSPRVVSTEESILIIPGTEIYLGDHGPIIYEAGS